MGRVCHNRRPLGKGLVGKHRARDESTRGSLSPFPPFPGFPPSCSTGDFNPGASPGEGLGTSFQHGEGL